MPVYSTCFSFKAGAPLQVFWGECLFIITIIVTVLILIVSYIYIYIYICAHGPAGFFGCRVPVQSHAATSVHAKDMRMSHSHILVS